jgi:uncharacterized membrane protein YhfC
MLLVAYLAQLTIMVGAPVALVIGLRRTGGARFALIGAGALAFVGSQVVHLPLNFALARLFRAPFMPQPVAHKMLFDAVFLGLTAGLCEETARFIVLRAWRKDARSFRDALVLGAGHGGIEAALLALAAVGSFVFMLAVRHHPPAAALGGEHGVKLAEAIAGYWAQPVWMPLLAGLERVVALALQLSLSTLVMQCFWRGRLWPLAAAIAWHALVDGTAVYLVTTRGVLVTEAVVALTLPISWMLLRWSRQVSARAQPAR